MFISSYANTQNVFYCLTTKNNLWCQLFICILRPHSSTLVDQLVLPVLFNEQCTMPHWMLKYRTLLIENRGGLYSTSCNLFNNQSCNICWSIKCWNVCHWFNSRSVSKEWVNGLWPSHQHCRGVQGWTKISLLLGQYIQEEEEEEEYFIYPRLSHQIYL